jgi:anti-anti-sigma factor
LATALKIDLTGSRVAVTGEVDLHAAPTIHAALAELSNGSATLDVSGVTFLDSSGLRALVFAKRDHPKLRIVDPSFVARRPPAAPELLVAEGLSPAFVDYLRASFPGFVDA